MKHLEGKIVFLRPTGNNVKRSAGNNQFTKEKIEKVGRIWISISNGRYKFGKEGYDDNELRSDHNSGYYVYETFEELCDYFEFKRLERLISDKFHYGRISKKVDIHDLRKVAKILCCVK